MPLCRLSAAYRHRPMYWQTIAGCFGRPYAIAVLARVTGALQQALFIDERLALQVHKPTNTHRQQALPCQYGQCIKQLVHLAVKDLRVTSVACAQEPPGKPEGACLFADTRIYKRPVRLTNGLMPVQRPFSLPPPSPSYVFYDFQCHYMLNIAEITFLQCVSYDCSQHCLAQSC